MEQKSWDYNAPQYVDFASPALNDINEEEYFKVDHENIDPQLSENIKEDVISGHESEPVECSRENVYTPGNKNSRKQLSEINQSLELQEVLPITSEVYKKYQSLKKKSEKVDLKLKSVKMDHANRLVKVARTRKVLQQNKEIKEAAFSTLLRGAVENLSDYHPTLTIPQPFNFHGKVKEEVKKAKEETLAEKCLNYSKKTPMRFRIKSFGKCKAVSMKRVIPKTPKLMTKSRSRRARVMSYEEKEQMEVEQECSKQFKATKMLNKLSLPLKIPPRPLTVVKEFEITKTSQQADVSVSKSSVPLFTARPVPAHILQFPVGVGAKVELPLTVPLTPAFSKLHATKKKEALLNAVVAPKMSEVEKEGPLTITQFAPFSFAGNEHKAAEQKEKVLQEELRKEKESRQFVANPIPDLHASPSLPSRKIRALTMVEPFELAGERRAQESHKRWKEKLELMEREEQQMKEFRARPAPLSNKQPFVPEKTNNDSLLSALTDTRHMPLNSEKRAEERREWQAWVKQKEEEAGGVRKEFEDIAKKEKEREMRKERMQTVHHASPIHHYNPIVVQSSEQPLTIPLSPLFSERISLKYMDKTLRAEEE